MRGAVDEAEVFHRESAATKQASGKISSPERYKMSIMNRKEKTDTMFGMIHWKTN